MAKQEKPDHWDFVVEGLASAKDANIKKVRLPDKPLEMTRGIKIIDCDVHFSEPVDMWTSRAPAGMKGRMPYCKRVEGVDCWFVDGDIPASFPGVSVITSSHDKMLGKMGLPTYEEQAPLAYDVKARLEMMDRFGIWGAVCYQNAMGVMGMATTNVNRQIDPDLALNIVKIYNDAGADRQRESGNRLFTQAHLPFWNRDEMLREARRSIEELKLTGLVLSDHPERIGLPTYNSEYWDPLWEFCNDRKVPLNFHLASGIDGFSFPWPDHTYGRKMAIGSMMLFLGCAATLANFIVSGLFDRYPELRLVSVESGLGWIPFMLEALEYQMDEMMPEEAKQLQKRPIEYFQDNIWASYWFEETGPLHMLEKIGVNKVLFETDWPHPTSLYPGVHEQIERTLSHVDDYTRRRVLQDNAVELYNLPMSAAA